MAHTATKEDQKRGLPHSLFLLIVSDDNKSRQPSDIDKVASAEIPDSAANPELYNIVTRHMFHGPCGPVNQTRPCMVSTGQVGKICDEHFPKEFQMDTVMTNGMYPEYRRKSLEDGGRTHKMKVRGQHFRLNNRCIIPYNPFLSLKYNAHINVEVVISVSCVKYLYKYTCKDSDHVMIRLANGDERHHK